MKKLLFIIFLFTHICFSQNDDSRLLNIKNKLELLSMESPGLNEEIKTDIDVRNITLENLLLGLSNIHKININLSQELNQITLVNNFTNVTVADLLVFLCKEYGLTIDFTGNIISIKKYIQPKEEPQISVVYDPSNNTVSIDANSNKLYDVFKDIMDETGKNLVFTPGLESKSITCYIKTMPFDASMDKLAFANDLIVQKTKDNFYLFEAIDKVKNGISTNRLRSNLNFKVINYDKKLLQVDFVDSPIADIINNIADELKLNIFSASPLDEAGSITLKTNSISFDELLLKIFEPQHKFKAGPENPMDKNSSTGQSNPMVNNASTPITRNYTFKKEGNIYYFGTENQLSVRKAEIIPLHSRTVEMFAEPKGGMNRNRTVGRTFNNFSSYNNTNLNNRYTTSLNGQYNSNAANTRNRVPITNNDYSEFSSNESKGEALLSVLPDELKQDLDIKIDYELNSFYVTGPASKIERFKNFIKKIDKPVPVVLIEVMLVEVSRSATVETGISWGIGDEPATTKGSIYPDTDITMGANTINKILNGFNGFGNINLGKVVPNFSATVKAMEANGNIKIRSTPRLSTLNGHRATFSNGQTSYYAVTQRNIYGFDNPQTSEITNYEPIDAELGLTIKPLVSGDGQVTLDIFVVQSSFGSRVSADAPPDLSSREFSSIIRVQDQDIVVLGGLEEQTKNDSGTGVPLLARIPVLKWLFSKRKREDSKAKLTVFIKPTIIY